MSQADGTYSLFDRQYTGGAVTISATLDGVTRTATAYEANPQDAKSPGLAFARNVAYANITFPAAAPTVPPSPVQITVMTLDANGFRKASNGIVIAGEQIVIGIRAGDNTVQRVDVQSGSQTTEYGVRVDPLAPQGGSFDVIAADSLPFATPGSYTVTATALNPNGGVVIGHTVIRAVVAGGGSNDPLPNDPPAVITDRTVPKADAKNVQIGALPQIVFTEPVQNVPAGVTLTEEGGAPIGVLLSGVGPSGPIANLTPQSVVTSITIQPSAGLKYGTTYTLSLSADIVDTDAAPNPNKPLTPYTTSFTTFAPESIGQTTELFTAGGMTVIGDRAYIATPQNTGRWFTSLRLFDVSDPTSPLEIASNEPSSSQVFQAPPAFFLGLPVDVVSQEESPLTGGPVVAVAVTPLAYPYHSSHVRLYDVSNDQQWKWIGAVSLGRDPSDGMIRRIEVKDTMLYAVTAGIGKGIQFVDLNAVQGRFDQALADGEQSAAYWQMQGQLNSTEGFAQETIVHTVAVDTGAGANSQLWDLAVTDLAINSLTQTAVVATGRSPLVIANQTDGLIYNGDITDGLGGPALTSWGYGIAAGTVAGQPLAIVSAGGVEGAPVSGPHVLAIVDLSNPAAPRALALLPLPGTAAGVQDVVLRDTSVFVGTNTGTYLVSIAEPASPRFVGTIAGVQGRLGFSSDSIVIGTRRGLTETTNADGGVRAAALSGPLLLIPRISPTLVRDIDATPSLGGDEEQQPPAQVREVVEDKKVRAIIIGGTAATSQAVLNENGKPITTVSLTLTGNSSGDATVPAGTRLSKGSAITIRISATTTDGDALVEERVAPMGAIKLVLDVNNDRKLDQSDVDAVGGPRTWAFWEAEPKFLSSTDPAIIASFADMRKPTLDGVADLATIELHVEAAARGLDIRMVSDDNAKLAETRWSLSEKQGTGLAYVTIGAEAQLQRDLVKKECQWSGAKLEGRCDAAGGAAIHLSNVQPGTYRYLFRCEKCPTDSKRRFEVIQSEIPAPLRTLQSSPIDVRPIQEWIGMLSARRPENADQVAGVLEPVLGWAPVTEKAVDLTVVVHGYGVDVASGQATLKQLFRNLYWTGLPVMFEPHQDDPFLQAGASQVVGVLWPGNVSGTTYFPGDEFTAFQAGVPLARFLQRRKALGQKLNIVAHSLGNLVVNSALLRASSLLPNEDRYLMIEAAVAAEAFNPDYDPANDGSFADPQTPLRQMINVAGGARDEGYPFGGIAADAKWDDYWQHGYCRDVEDVTCGQRIPVQQDWAERAAEMHDALLPKPTYTMRWRTATFGFSPWRGIFQTTFNRVQTWNYFNQNDQALEIVENDVRRSPWRLAQIAQKPYVKGDSLFGMSVDASGLTWALNDPITKGEDFGYLWTDSPEGLPVRIATMRKWAELSFQFQPVSPAAGTQAIVAPGLAGNENMTSIGGSGGGLSYESHTYWTRPLSSVLPFYVSVLGKLRRTP